MENDDIGYSKKEVAKLLRIAESTVYQYATQNKIKALPNPYKVLSEAQYDKKSVDELRVKLNIDGITGMSISSFAKEQKVPQNKIYKLIHSHGLEVDLVPRGEVRKQYFIPKNTQEELAKILEESKQKRGTRTDFYLHSEDIALYQVFLGANGNQYRVTRKGANKWGFYLHTGEWIDFSKALENFKLKPMYKIHQKTVRSIGYANFVIPKDTDEIYEYIDFVYRTWGIENCSISEEEKFLNISLKSGRWKAVDYTPYEEFALHLTSYAEIGSIELINGFYEVEGDIKRTTIDFSIGIYHKLLEHVESNKTNLRDVVEEALEKYLE